VPKVAVVTDTTAYLPSELVEAAEIRLVSLYVNWPDDSQREADIGDLNSFYERLRSADQLPTTSQPSIGDFLQIYEPLIDQGSEIVSIHISGGISGTVESARQAREQLSERGASHRVTVLDSRTAAGGLGLVVLAAARAAAEGASRQEVEETAAEARAALKMWFAVDTLEYLRRGGRIGAASALMGTALKIKPILTLDNEITPIERVRTSARALDRLTDYARQRKDDGADGWVVQHSQAPEQAARLAASTQEIMGRPPTFISEIGPVLGAHIGPGLLGVGGVPAQMVQLPIGAGSGRAGASPMTPS
jgi:DegV family protein with EDD domain